jgi:hypothetical protein
MLIQAAVAGFTTPVTRMASGSKLNMIFDFFKKKEPEAPKSKTPVVVKKVYIYIHIYT